MNGSDFCQWFWVALSARLCILLKTMEYTIIKEIQKIDDSGEGFMDCIGTKGMQYEKILKKLGYANL